MGETEELKKKWNMSEEDINNIKKNIKYIIFSIVFIRKEW